MMKLNAVILIVKVKKVALALREGRGRSSLMLDVMEVTYDDVTMTNKH